MRNLYAFIIIFVNNYHYVSLPIKILVLELREPKDEQLCKAVNIYIHNIDTLDEVLK